MQEGCPHGETVRVGQGRHGGARALAAFLASQRMGMRVTISCDRMRERIQLADFHADPDVAVA